MSHHPPFALHNASCREFRHVTGTALEATGVRRYAGWHSRQLRWSCLNHLIGDFDRLMSRHDENRRVLSYLTRAVLCFRTAPFLSVRERRTISIHGP